MIQHIGNVIDSNLYKESIAESLEYFSDNENLTMYFHWCFAHKRTWSDSFAFWCDNQIDLTDQKITRKWREMALAFRSRDLNNAIKNAETRKADRAAIENNPDSKRFVKYSKLRLDGSGLPY